MDSNGSLVPAHVVPKRGSRIGALLSSSGGVPDFIMMDKIDEESFLDNLKKRFATTEIYTYIGEVVVAMNPFKQLNLYEANYVNDYRGREMYVVKGGNTNPGCGQACPSTTRTVVRCPRVAPQSLRRAKRKRLGCHSTWIGTHRNPWL